MTAPHVNAPKQYLVILRQCDELLISEGIQAAMIFASFGESVALAYSVECSGLINQTGTHIAKLISSLEFYDIEAPLELNHELSELNFGQFQNVLSF